MERIPLNQDETYIYTVLPSPTTIRLLELQAAATSSTPIQVTLHEFDLPIDTETSLNYTALSYTWGPPDETNTIYLSRKRCNVRKNLYDALLHLRHATEATRWWIDALCINQGDLFEKSRQVDMMARIYRSAGCVRVWLGMEDEDGMARRAFEFIRLKSNGSLRSDEVLQMDFNDGIEITGDDLRRRQDEIATMQKALGDLLKRDYWSRMWIIQEVVLARRIMVQCGSLMVEWEGFSDTCFQNIDVMSGGSPPLQLIAERDALEEMVSQRSLEGLIGKYCESLCSEPRDKVFALISLATDCAMGNGLRADYTLSRFELLVRTVRYCKPRVARWFVGRLFHTLQRAGGDDERWEKARLAWRKACSDSSVADRQGSGHLADQQTRQVTITQFVTATSLFRDWVRYDSMVALLDSEFLRSSNSLVTNFSTGEASAKMPVLGSEYAAVELDNSNVAVSIGENHYAILSANQIAAVANPCAALKLHADSSRCSVIRCCAL